MTIFTVIFFATFVVAFVVGWYFHRAFVWNYVDIIYYPLAAIGVALLFSSNSTQRELLEINGALENHRKNLSSLQSNKPDVNISDTAGLLSEGIKSIALIQSWVDICDGGPSSADAECLAVEGLGPHVQEFLEVSGEHYESYEDRLFGTCSAGDRLLREVIESNAISTLVAKPLLQTYLDAAASQLHFLDYDGVRSRIDAFNKETTSYAQEIHKLTFPAETSQSQLLLQIRMAEIEYGEMILNGLSQCITAPRAELNALRDWKIEENTQADEISKLDKEGKELENGRVVNSSTDWVQLNLWPFLLIFALSMKFAKGVAALKRAE